MKNQTSIKNTVDLPNQPSTNRTLLIDMHAHVFNAAYLPLEGIFRARGLSPIVSRLLRRIMEGIVESEELSQNTAFGLALKSFSTVSQTDSKALNSVTDLVTLLATTAPTDVIEAHAKDIDTALAELDASVVQQSDKGLSVAEDDVTLEIAIADNFAGMPAATERNKLVRLLRLVARIMENGIALIKWIVLLLRKETTIIDDLCATFPDVELFIHHTMDLGPHYKPERCSYPFESRQIQRVRALTNLYNGKLLPFIAYSPFRENGVQLIRDCIERGFAGVKFYPPSGYRPIGNTAEDLRNVDHNPADVDRRNLELFRLCVEHDIPIFAHCQPGEFQRYKGAGCLSHPEGWRKVLETDGLERLRLCLGHAGGEGWTAGDAQEDAEALEHCCVGGFISSAVNLCTEYDNVYIEFGCMETILEQKDAVPNLAARLNRYLKQHGNRLGQSIIYGSDWHMLARTPGVENYATVLRRMFANDPGLKEYEHAFLSGNALRFLNLQGFLDRSDGNLSGNVRTHLQQILSRAEPLAIP